ncbi:alkaline phosphatase family protein [Vibrio sinensis]|uniref:Alkaline phosphatase family protein n=1 Tax=Vibrio sinensis TaxID=2302434 RepID=A0A3A6QCS6_9VIBR|nr:alkaline phosphatase family protein [Vibrio sinensis]RJX69529.1 alkaline phosphatase family protein [Vibrio sinensis]
MIQDSPIPLILAGPILRKTTPDELVFWFVTSEPLIGHFQLFDEPEQALIYQADLAQCQQLKVGDKAYVVLAQFKSAFPTNVALSYQFKTQQGLLTDLVPSLVYQDEVNPVFTISTKADYVLHGSCRNPHHPSKDALVQADLKIAKLAIQDRPDMLMMSGDQIYADHVAGPMLDAIHQVIELLGLPDESFVSDEWQASTSIPNSTVLYQHPDCFYGRESILPRYQEQKDGVMQWLPARHKPIFSSRECHNHLITFAEFFAMYILVWSPQLWSRINLTRLADNRFTHGGKTLTPRLQQQWRDERDAISDFIAGLPNVQRLFAHVPTYMIFDDHDITDDWNLTIGWEKAAHENPFAKRLIGNGMIAYWLCQGWGNEPDNFQLELLPLAERYFSHATSQQLLTQAVTDPTLDIASTSPHSIAVSVQQETAHRQDDLIRYLYTFERWHYTIHTSPKVVVLDTRTRRWRSESRMNKPSGLMDWEALIEFHQELMHQDKVIIVSAAPMFGVKFIETMQRAFTWLGEPLLIDAENWMAHPGSANTLLSIFTHTKTPTNFVILSGDVHYSFAYDIKLRFRKCSPNIFQITCSGFKNQFPEPLLAIFDRIDRALYSPRSPLNYLTKRKRLKISKRDPDIPGHRRLVNASAIGELKLDSKGKPSQISILTGDGMEIYFPPIETKPQHLQVENALE